MINEIPRELQIKSRINLRNPQTRRLNDSAHAKLPDGTIIPIKEARPQDNVVVLEPGESSLSENFRFCSAVIASKNGRLYLIHILPNVENGTEEFIENMVRQQIITPDANDKFNKVLLIGRVAINHLAEFRAICVTEPQIIQINDKDENSHQIHDYHDVKTFDILVYNNPKQPGDISSFDLWFNK